MNSKFTKDVEPFDVLPYLGGDFDSWDCEAVLGLVPTEIQPDREKLESYLRDIKLAPEQIALLSTITVLSKDEKDELLKKYQSDLVLTAYQKARVYMAARRIAFEHLEKIISTPEVAQKFAVDPNVLEKLPGTVRAVLVDLVLGDNFDEKTYDKIFPALNLIAGGNDATVFNELIENVNYWREAYPNASASRIALRSYFVSTTKDFMKKYQPQVEELLNNTRTPAQVTFTQDTISIPVGRESVPVVDADIVSCSPTNERPLTYIESATIRATNYLADSNILSYVSSIFGQGGMGTYSSMFGVPPSIVSSKNPDLNGE